jgi:hypothetical protein
MIRKDVIFAILTIFSLCVLIFAVIPIRSGLPYDPWTDINEDGVINMKDIANAAAQFMATGDPTKNVTITGHANKLAYSIEEQPVAAGGYFLSPYISVDGYSKVTVCINDYNPPSTFNHYELGARHFNSSSEPFGVDKQLNITSLVKTYDVPNQEIVIAFYNYKSTQSSVWIDVYLIA